MKDKCKKIGKKMSRSEKSIHASRYMDLPNSASTFEKEDPASIEEQEDRETKFDRVAHGLDVVYRVIEAFPRAFANTSIVQEKAIDTDRDDDLHDHFDAKR